MSAVEPQKPVDVPSAGTVEPAPAPIEPVHIDKLVTPTTDAPKAEEAKPEGEVAAAAPVEEAKDEKKDEKPVAKAAEPIHSGALGYKAPGLKNAFRYSKKYFWFGEEPVPSTNLREYLRGEKPEVAHPAAAWSSQTGKGLLFFVKHADQKEHPAGILPLAYATDLHKDGLLAFALKISGHKHSFEAQSAAERDGWYVAVEKAIADAKEAKEGVESSEGYKEQKEKIGKPTTLAAAAVSTPKKSTDATPKPAETEAPAPAADEAVTAAPARAGSSSSSSSDEEKKAKKAKSKSRSASRKRASIFGGLLGKKDKTEDKVEQKKEEPKVDEAEASKTVPEVKKDETPAVAPIAETSTTAPVITTDIPKVEESKADATVAPIAPAPVEEAKPEEPVAKSTEEKPKPTKRGSIFGSFFEKVKSPTHEKKEADVGPAPPAKDATPAPEAAKPLEEAQVAVPATIEPVTEPAKVEEPKPAHTKPVSTPTKEKDHFSFGGLFGKKDRAKSPAPASKDIPATEPSKVDPVAPKIEDTPAVAEPTPAEPVVAAPVTETKADPAPVADKKDEVAPAKKEEVPAAKKEKRGSIFGSLSRSISKATKGNKEPKEKKEATNPTTVPETTEPKDDKAIAPVLDDKKEETPAAAAPAPAEKSIGDVVPEAVTVGEAPKSNPTVPTTA